MCTSFCDFVQLEGLGARYPAQLSGGQRQRVALARALAIEPRVLLLDEPFGALDARVRKDLRRWLREVHKQTGLTTVFVTHDQDEAMELADRVVVLNEGRIEQIGTPAELYDQPASPFVISFVGEAVALPVTIADGHVRFGNRELHVDTHGLRSGPAQVFFRPADIAVAADGTRRTRRPRGESAPHARGRSRHHRHRRLRPDARNRFAARMRRPRSATACRCRSPRRASFPASDEYLDVGEGI